MTHPPIVIEVMRAGGRNYVKLREAPREFEGNWAAAPLNVKMSNKPYNLLHKQPLAPGSVLRCGKDLCEKIAVDVLREVLDHIAHPEPDEEFPIYIMVGPPESENLPWEAMWRERFLALSPNWPIARLTASTIDARPQERAVESQLKVMAILAADRIDASGEWTKLYNAVKGHGNRVRLHVILSQRDLRDAIRALADPQITCEFVGDARSLVQRVQSFGPNIVHFFCHGVSGANAQLQLVKRSGEIESITLNTLMQLAVLDTIWLVTFNCCQIGQSADSVRSIARDLVAKGVPAAIAMRENVLWSDANLFTGTFYDVLISHLVPLLPSEPLLPSTAPFVLPESVWLRALQPSRIELHNVHYGNPPVPRCPEDTIEWTLPMLYVRRGELQLKPRPLTMFIELEDRVKEQAELSYLSRTRQYMMSLKDAPENTIEVLAKEIEKLEQRLKTKS